MMIKVLHRRWKIVVRSDKVHESKFPQTHAVAVLEDRKIHVRKSSLTSETIIHELIHAYQYELSYTELQLDDDQTEEWFAELFCKYGKHIIQTAESVVKSYIKK
jgi:hypothetical protein